MPNHPARQGVAEIQALHVSIRSCRQKSLAHVRISYAVDRNFEWGIHNGTTRPEPDRVEVITDALFLTEMHTKTPLFVVPVKSKNL